MDPADPSNPLNPCHPASPMFPGNLDAMLDGPAGCDATPLVLWPLFALMLLLAVWPCISDWWRKLTGGR